MRIFDTFGGIRTRWYSLKQCLPAPAQNSSTSDKPNTVSSQSLHQGAQGTPGAPGGTLVSGRLACASGKNLLFADEESGKRRRGWEFVLFMLLRTRWILPISSAERTGIHDLSVHARTS